MEGGPRGPKRNTSVDSSSEAGSMVDNIEAEYIRDILKRRRSAKEARLNNAMQQGVLGNSGVPEFHARLLALRLAVQDYKLPIHLAYDELEELAANTERVKSAIDKNMTLLTVQIRRSNYRYYRSSFTAWVIYIQKKAAKRIAKQTATDYFWRRMLGRAFQAWHIYLLRQQKFKGLQISVQKMLRRRNLTRIWNAWKSLVKKRLREDEKHWREKQLVRDLNLRQKDSIRKRAVNAIHRRRLQRAYFAFKIAVEIVKDRHAQREHIFYIVVKRKVAVAFKFWEKYPGKRERDLRAIKRKKRRVTNYCFSKWEDETAFLKYQRHRMSKCRLLIAFEKWIFFLKEKVKYDTIVAKVTRMRLKRNFGDLREACLEQKWKIRTYKRAKMKCQLLKLRWFFEVWITYMQIRVHERALRIEQYAMLLEDENQKTRFECDRLGRIIDTGEWDQQRLTELESASHILSGEKEALIKLAARLDGEHQKAMDHQERQEQEIKQLRDEMLGCNFLRRNKLLVKGASSFNSVLRAVKSEVVKQGVDPELVSSIDNKLLDQVVVFPDGDLRVKPMNKFDKGKWTPETR